MELECLSDVVKSKLPTVSGATNMTDLEPEKQSLDDQVTTGTALKLEEPEIQPRQLKVTFNDELYCVREFEKESDKATGASAPPPIPQRCRKSAAKPSLTVSPDNLRLHLQERRRQSMSEFSPSLILMALVIVSFAVIVVLCVVLLAALPILRPQYVRCRDSSD